MKRYGLLGLLALLPLLLCPFAGYAQIQPKPMEVEHGVLREMNRVRTEPRRYAEEVVKPLLSRYKGKTLKQPGQIDLRTQEGVKPVRELYRYLLTVVPVEPLTLSRGLSLAAQAHAHEQGKYGAVGHQSRDGRDTFERIEEYGRFMGTAGENISYGPKDPQEVVLQLLIDDGVPSRGHRDNIMSRSFGVCGVGFAKHKKWRYVVVIDYATEFKTDKNSIID